MSVMKFLYGKALCKVETARTRNGDNSMKKMANLRVVSIYTVYFLSEKLGGKMVDRIEANAYFEAKKICITNFLYNQNK